MSLLSTPVNVQLVKKKTDIHQQQNILHRQQEPSAITG